MSRQAARASAKAPLAGAKAPRLRTQRQLARTKRRFPIVADTKQHWLRASITQTYWNGFIINPSEKHDGYFSAQFFEYAPH